MHKPTRPQLADLAKGNVKPRLLANVKLPAEDMVWKDAELVACWDKGEKKGILLIELDKTYIAPFELGGRIADSRTGRTKPVICDLCCTWQQGGKAATITCTRQSDGHTFTYLCCADLCCSLHIRDKTAQAALSRAQLRENCTLDQRRIRLRRRLQKLISTLEL